MRTTLLTMLVLFVGCEARVGGGEEEKPTDAPDAHVELPQVDGGVGCQVLALVETRCGSCHGNPTAPGVPVSLNSLLALRAPSPVAGRTYLDRSLARMESGTMPPPPAAPPSEEELALLRQWRDDGAPECDTGSGGPVTYKTPNQIPQDQLFQCSQTGPSSSPSRLVRVGRDEWSQRFEVNNYNSPPAWRSRAPFEHSANDAYSTYASDETIDDATLEMFMDATMLGSAGPSAWTWTKRQPGFALSCIENQASPDAACIDGFVKLLLRRGASFREPTAAEVAKLTAYTQVVLAADAGSRAAVIEEVSSAALMMTGTLFRSELGEPGIAGRAHLTDWELAQALSMTIGHRLPGAPRVAMRAPSGLVDYFCCSGGQRDGYSVDRNGFLTDIAAAADDGTISDPAVLRGFIRKYAAGQMTSDGGTVDRLDLGIEVEFGERSRHSRYWTSTRVRGFFREWLGYEPFASVFKEQPARTSKYQPLNYVDPIYSPLIRTYDGLRAEDEFGNEPSMVRLLDNTIARVVAEDRDVLEQLLTTRNFYLQAKGAGGTGTPFIYDAEVPANQDGRWVTMPADQRAGVLTHPAWLGAHAGNFHDDPSIVHRGKWVREKLLCQYVPPLSEVTVNAMVGPSHPSLSARQRLDEATGSAECQSCHKLMNPLGYPFEIYNHAGYVRVTDYGDAGVDGHALLVDMPDPSLDGPVRDAIEMSEKFAQSNHVKRCFVRQTFRYFTGRDETLADACTLQQMEAAYDQQGSFVQMLETLVTSDTYLYRSTP